MSNIYKIEITQRGEESYELRKEFELQVSLHDEQFAKLIAQIVSIATDPGLAGPNHTPKQPAA